MAECPTCHVTTAKAGISWAVDAVDKRSHPQDYCTACDAHKTTWPSFFRDPTAVRAALSDSASLKGTFDECRADIRSCGHTCRINATKHSPWCCRMSCSGRSNPCSVCAPDCFATSVAFASGAAAAAVVHRVALADAMGHHFSISGVAAKDRGKRLRDGPTMVLYHQTEPHVVTTILSTLEMRLGTQGVLGGGIYFAESPGDTVKKAHKHGGVVEAHVKVS